MKKQPLVEQLRELRSCNMKASILTILNKQRNTSITQAENFQSLSCTIASTSTDISNGNVLVPIADRAWYPTGLPNTSIIRSEQPSITLCCSLKSFVDCTIPNI